MAKCSSFLILGTHQGTWGEALGGRRRRRGLDAYHGAWGESIGGQRYVFFLELAMTLEERSVGGSKKTSPVPRLEQIGGCAYSSLSASVRSLLTILRLLLFNRFKSK